MKSKAVPKWYSLASRSCWLLYVAALSAFNPLNYAHGRDSELYQPALNSDSIGSTAVESYQLTLIDTPQLNVLPVSVFDLVSTRGQGIHSSYQGQAVTSGGAFVVSLPFEAPSLPTYIRREIPSLWRVTVPAGRRVDPLPLRFEWEETQQVGRDGEAVNALKPQLYPWIHSRRRDELGRTVVEGGVWLDIPVQQLQHQTYRGRVLVLLDEY